MQIQNWTDLRKEPDSLTSMPSILHENLFPCQVFVWGQQFFWNFCHAISGIWPEHEYPSVEVICRSANAFQQGKDTDLDPTK